MGRTSKEEYIRRYGKEQYEECSKDQYEKYKDGTKEWKRTHSAQVQARNKKESQKRNRKDGEHYKESRMYQMTGIPHEKNLIRVKHRDQWRPYKQIIAPESQIHHEWIPSTCEYRGIALVEADSHMHGYIDVIQILEGEITLLYRSGN